MQLIPLREHKASSKVFLDMFCDYTIEQEIEQGQKKSRDEVYRECEAMLHERLCDSNRQIFLFDQNKTIVGFAEILLEEECFPDEDMPETCVKVIAFYIAPPFRRHHHGTAFFKLIRNWGRDQKAALLEIEVPSYPVQVNEFLVHQGLELVGTGVQNCYRSFI
jgi:hypothetical protein